MAVTIPPADLAPGTSAPGTPELLITAFRALQVVNILVAMEVSSQLGAATPTLVGGERPCWSVPVWLSFPDCGRVGQAGTVQVDAHTGEVLAEAETLREIAENASALLNVPHFKQEFHYSCVPACARMVLAFFGSHHTEAELRTLMRTDPSGTPARRLMELRHLGFDVAFVTTDIAGLANYLTSGLPPIALLKTASLPYWPVSCDHFAIIVGADDSWVYLNDPYFDSAPQQVSHSDFLLAWSPYACTAAIVRPRP